MPEPDAFQLGPRARTADGLGIATYDLGGAGRPLLLAHATGFHGRMWLPVVRHLRGRYHCIAFDERGHGESDKAPNGDYDWRGFALDALAVIDAWGLSRPLAAGHSCGGTLLLLAEMLRPGTLDAVYCYEPVIFPRLEDGLLSQNPLAEGTRHRREAFPSREDAAANYRAKPPMSRFAPDALTAYVTWGFEDLPDGSVRLRCRRDDEARMYELGAHNGVFEALGDIATPATVVCGDDGPHFDKQAIETIAARLAHSRTEVISGVGHFGPFERPEAVAASIDAALATTASPPG
jgi:pimeloyl-ACP methyl ester carboxylesterase